MLAGRLKIFRRGRRHFQIIAGILITLSMDPGASAHEVHQRVGGYSSSEGESRMMTKFTGLADAQIFSNSDLQLSVSLSAQSESIRSEDVYTQKYFDRGRRLNRNFGIDTLFTFAKKTEITMGGSDGGDSVTKTRSASVGVSQWFLGDQLRVGVNAATAKISRPEDSFLDYDSATIIVPDEVVSSIAGLTIKAILNPKTTVSGSYSLATSTERPILRAWTTGFKQYFDDCDCALHGDVGRVINLGQLDTTMSVGELTGTQFSLAYLQSLWPKAHARLGYRYAREDEFTRAYEDHLVFGADSYVAAFSQEIDGVEFAGRDRTLLVDMAATRYLHNKSGTATTLEFGGTVKF